MPGCIIRTGTCSGESADKVNFLPDFYESRIVIFRIHFPEKKTYEIVLLDFTGLILKFLSF